VFLHSGHSDESDEALVQRYRMEGKLEWLSVLFLRYAPLVYGVCLKYLEDRDDAKDAVMEIHERLIISLRQHEVSNFRAWLHVTARNHCLMILRSKKSHPKEEITTAFMENGQSYHPEDDIALAQDHERLAACLKTLPAPQQQCVSLFYLEDKSYREIIAFTGFDHNQVKSYIQNGKRNLRQCMERNE